MKRRIYLLAISGLWLVLGACAMLRQSSAPGPETSLPNPIPESSVAEELPLPDENEAAETIDPLEDGVEVAASENSSLPDQPPEPAEVSIVDVPESSRDAESSSEPPQAVEQAAGQVAAVEPPAMAPASTRLDAERIEQELLRRINTERQANGVEPLGMEETMRFAARIRAAEALQSLSHTRPGDQPYYTAFDEAGFLYAGKWHGENIAMVSARADQLTEEIVADTLFQNWTGSTGHYGNIISENFLQTGMGIHIETDGANVLVGAAQLFASL